MSVVDEFDDIATAINIASESTDYERKIEKLSEEAASNDTYQKILEELENNQRALNRLKERYLGKQKTNK
jgi:cell division protein ZapA (FtsZ GTPase activity inhibitor)